MSDKELIEKIKKLSPEEKQEIENLLDTIFAKKHNPKEKSIESLHGVMKGKVWMSDDFDEPLEDFKDYM